MTVGTTAGDELAQKKYEDYAIQQDDI